MTVDHKEIALGIEVALVGFDKTLKVVRVSQGQELLPQGEFYLSFLNEPVVSCVWDAEARELVMGTEKGAIFRYNLNRKDLVSDLQMYRKEPVKIHLRECFLVVRGYGVYCRATTCEDLA